MAINTGSSTGHIVFANCRRPGYDKASSDETIFTNAVVMSKMAMVINFGTLFDN